MMDSYSLVTEPGVAFKYVRSRFFGGRFGMETPSYRQISMVVTITCNLNKPYFKML